jgi:5-methylcytosine-specific restriction endonuclease McrA
MKMKTTKTSSRSKSRPSSSDQSCSIDQTRSRQSCSQVRSASGNTASLPGIKTLKGISDAALLSSVRKLSRSERKTVLKILVHLVEIDRRSLYLGKGYPSLFQFCRGELGYSESTAGRRIAVARCMARYPQVHKLLSSGRVDFCNVAMISRVITASNSGSLLSRIEGASKREVEELVGRHDPRTRIRERVKPVYVRTELTVPADADTSGPSVGEAESGKFFTSTGGSAKTASRDAVSLTGANGTSKNGALRDTAAGCGDGSPGAGRPAAAISSGGEPAGATDTGSPRTRTMVVLEQRFKVEFGVDQSFIDKVEEARSLLSSKHRGNLGMGELLELALDELIERRSPRARQRRRQERKRKAEEKKASENASKTVPRNASKKGRNDQGPERSRYIPKAVRDRVFLRDEGRCTFTGPGGRRCSSTRDLQVDHIVPFARGGGNSMSNLRLLCGKHNRLEAERAYGQGHMERYRKVDRKERDGRSDKVPGSDARESKFVYSITSRHLPIHTVMRYLII